MKSNIKSLGFVWRVKVPFCINSCSMLCGVSILVWLGWCTNFWHGQSCTCSSKPVFSEDEMETWNSWSVLCKEWGMCAHQNQHVTSRTSKMYQWNEKNPYIHNLILTFLFLSFFLFLIKERNVGFPFSSLKKMKTKFKHILPQNKDECVDVPLPPHA